MQAELLIKGGRVIDPAQNIDAIMDVAVSGGKIAALGADSQGAAEAAIIDAAGQIVTPGLIDLHAHVVGDLVSLAVHPDEAGVSTGVTSLADAGSLGRANLPPFRRYILPQTRSSVYLWLHISPVGEVVLPEVGYEAIDEAATIQFIEANRDLVRGIKIRAVGELIHSTQVDVLAAAQRVARRVGLPIMVHVGMNPDEPLSADQIGQFTGRLLSMLEAGDVITHAYTDKPGGVFAADGSPVEGLEAALARGVLLDAAPGRGHLSFKVAQAAISQGYRPAGLGTDVVRLADEQPHFYNVAAVASKFMALGLSLQESIAAVTIKPARILGAEDACGSLRPGLPADITISKLHEGSFMFHDGRAMNVIQGSAYLSPQRCLKAGEVFTVRESFASHVPTPAAFQAYLEAEAAKMSHGKPR